MSSGFKHLLPSLHLRIPSIASRKVLAKGESVLLASVPSDAFGLDFDAALIDALNLLFTTVSTKASAEGKCELTIALSSQEKLCVVELDRQCSKGGPLPREASLSDFP